MGIANRDKDVSEQKQAFTVSLGNKLAPNVTSSTLIIGSVPFSSELSALSVVGLGLSGAPQLDFRIARFIPGGGHTVIAIGASCVLPSMGVSGPLGVSLPGSGNSLVQLLAGDQIIAFTAVANTSADTITVGYVLKALQDFKATYGSTT